MIATYDKSVPNYAKDYISQTDYQIKKLEMVFDVDSFLKTLRSEPDYYIADPEKYYNRKELTQYINSLY